MYDYLSFIFSKNLSGHSTTFLASGDLERKCTDVIAPQDGDIRGAEHPHIKKNLKVLIFFYY